MRGVWVGLLVVGLVLIGPPPVPAQDAPGKRIVEETVAVVHSGTIEVACLEAAAQMVMRHARVSFQRHEQEFVLRGDPEGVFVTGRLLRSLDRWSGERVERQALGDDVSAGLLRVDPEHAERIYGSLAGLIREARVRRVDIALLPQLSRVVLIGPDESVRLLLTLGEWWHSAAEVDDAPEAEAAPAESAR